MSPAATIHRTGHQRGSYYRYFRSEINEFTHEDLANMTQIDYDREMAFVAVRRMDNAEESPRRNARDLRS